MAKCPCAKNKYFFYVKYRRQKSIIVSKNHWVATRKPNNRWKKKYLKKSLGYKHTQRSQHDQGGYALKGVNIIWVGIWHVMSGSRNQ